MVVEIPLDLGERTDLHGREVEGQHKERVPERRRVASDVGHAEQLVEAVLEVDVVVVREHGADNRLAEALRPQEHGRRHILQLSDVGRIVHEKAFADQRGPVDHAVRDSALFLHAAQYSKKAVSCVDKTTITQPTRHDLRCAIAYCQRGAGNGILAA